MIHSGSRNIGKSIADVHISRAKGLAHNDKLVDRDLSVFLAGTPEMAAYRRDLQWAQRYARLNVETMMDTCKKVVQDYFQVPVQTDMDIFCSHNYVSEEFHYGEQVFITRKGAISAQLGEMGIIPGSMGTSSFIVCGQGNPESFQSASHGAGRRMSRSQAKKKFTLEDMDEQLGSLESRRDSGMIDELPGAYKDVREVMANQTDLVEIVTELRAVLCIKG